MTLSAGIEVSCCVVGGLLSLGQRGRLMAAAQSWWSWFVGVARFKGGQQDAKRGLDGGTARTDAAAASLLLRLTAPVGEGTSAVDASNAMSWT